jgi:hypothetical protein
MKHAPDALLFTQGERIAYEKRIASLFPADKVQETVSRCLQVMPVKSGFSPPGAQRDAAFSRGSVASPV